MSKIYRETSFVTEQEYLSSESNSLEKHEYLNGFVYALHWNPVTSMAGANESHVNITGNAYYALRTHLHGTSCQTYMTDMRLRISAKDKAWFYPDVMVTCEPEDRSHKIEKYSPILIIEVLSKSTKDYDKGGKFDAYRQLNSLREYVLIDPETHLVQIYRVNEHHRWELFTFEGTDTVVYFSSVNLHLPINDLYENVDFT